MSLHKNISGAQRAKELFKPQKTWQVFQPAMKKKQLKLTL